MPDVKYLPISDLERGAVTEETLVPVSNGSSAYAATIEDIKFAVEANADVAEYGSPLTATSASDMVYKKRVYVYTGTTTSSLTNGNWYYWNGNAWASGGVYNSTAFVSDPTLSISGAAADAKATGDKLKELRHSVKFGALDLLGQFAKPTKSTANISLSWSGDVATVTGKATSASEAIANYYSVSSTMPEGFTPGQTLYIKVKTTSTYIRLGIIPYVNGVAQTASYFTSDAVWTIPSNTTGLVIRVSLIQNVTFSGDTFEAYILNSQTNADIDALATENRATLELFNSIDHLRQFAKPTKSTANITISWSGETATVNGTATSASEAVADYYSNTAALPSGIKAGETVYIKVKTTNDYIRLCIIPYVSGTEQTALYFTADDEWAIPNNVTGMIIRLSVVQNVNYSSEKFEAHILSAPANSDISGVASNIEKTLVSFNSVDFLEQFAKPEKSTANITIAWSGDVATINGKATSASEAIADYYSDTSAMPDGIKAGDTVYIKVKTTNDYIRLCIIPYVSGTAQTALYFTSDDKWDIPSTVTGMVIRLSVVQNVTFSSEKFEAYILNAPTNSDISKVSSNAEASLRLYNSDLILAGNSSNSKTHNHVTYTWSNDSTCTVSGTASAASFCNIYADYTALPGGLSAGDKFYFDYTTTDPGVRGVLLFYDSNQANVGTIGTDKPIPVTVPAGSVGAIVRLSVNNGLTVSGNASLKLLTAESNWDLQTDVDAIEARVGVVTKTPMLTIIDDDGNSKFYTDLYPMAMARQVPISAAVPFSSIGTANHLTMSQIKSMVSDGIEILSHTYSHWTDFTGKTEQDFEVDYRSAKYSYALEGINCNLLVYSGSSGNLAAAKEAAKRVYDGAIASGNQNINYCGDNKYFIQRYGINGDGSGGRLNGEDFTDLVNAIDDLKANGGWMIWMTHTSGEYWTNTMLSNISSAIYYALTEGVAIVTAEYGFKTYFGN